ATNPREKVGETTVRSGKFKGQTRAITVNGLARAATQYAEAVVARTVVRKLNPRRHSLAAAREARAAQDARRKGDVVQAIAHKRNQLLHERSARVASEAVTEAKKAQAYLAKFRRSNRARG